eukprot:scaffold56839_cov50-Phaeocystis_antarctica.AAC.2
MVDGAHGAWIFGLRGPGMRDVGCRARRSRLAAFDVADYLLAGTTSRRKVRVPSRCYKRGEWASSGDTDTRRTLYADFTFSFFSCNSEDWLRHQHCTTSLTDRSTQNYPPACAHSLPARIHARLTLERTEAAPSHVSLTHPNSSCLQKLTTQHD